KGRAQGVLPDLSIAPTVWARAIIGTVLLEPHLASHEICARDLQAPECLKETRIIAQVIRHFVDQILDQRDVVRVRRRSVPSDPSGSSPIASGIPEGNWNGESGIARACCNCRSEVVEHPIRNPIASQKLKEDHLAPACRLIELRIQSRPIKN